MGVTWFVNWSKSDNKPEKNKEKAEHKVIREPLRDFPEGFCVGVWCKCYPVVIQTNWPYFKNSSIKEKTLVSYKCNEDFILFYSILFYSILF